MTVVCIYCNTEIPETAEAVQEAGGSWYHLECWLAYLKDCGVGTE